MGYAQDFSPGQQAEGLLDSKDVVVDHATGTFHYKVPLYKLTSGNYELPISLDYIGNGVKVEDVPGLIGYNWTLNAGGVITRTIRGGIPDEGVYGYVSHGMICTTPLIEEATKVNKRIRDGESDIFTAVFNGKTINFILGFDDDYKICVKPLERTNVRIECEYLGMIISKWILTDEDGTRYTYAQREWIMDVCNQGAVSFNNITGENYITSWYLSKIEPLNSGAIIYQYKKNVEDGHDLKNIAVNSYCNSYKTTYSYGQAITEFVYPGYDYKRFDEAIAGARRYLELSSWSLNLDLHCFNSDGTVYRNPYFEANVSSLQLNWNVMGVLSNYSYLSQSVGELISSLNTARNLYGNRGTYFSDMIAMYLDMALECVTMPLYQSFKSVRNKDVYNGVGYTVYSPLLEKVIAPNQIVRFEYDYGKLKNVQLNDWFGTKISKISLTSSEFLNSISFLDKNGIESNAAHFDYYMFPEDVELDSDLWGYPRRYYPVGDIGDDIKAKSLKKIRLINGGNIIVDYEPNTIAFSPAWGIGTQYGGIRIKSLVLDDGFNSIRDTISYHYPRSGMLVYSSYSNNESVDYQFFSDWLTYSKVRFKGPTFLNTGNNGIYYDYVTEVFKGRGSNAYWFHVPLEVVENRFSAFWLNGLPLGKASYDSDGNLKRMTKNKYYTDMSFSTRDKYCLFGNNDSFFVDSGSLLSYCHSIPQLKAFEFYMDAKDVEPYYHGTVDILPWTSSYSFSIDLRRLYLNDIEPRTNAIAPNLYYELRYGGKTLLKEQAEYIFEEQVTQKLNYTDLFTDFRNEPFRKFEYCYDNLANSTLPTRINEIDSNRDSYTSVYKRVTEIDDGDKVWEDMKRLNILTPLVKQLNLKNDQIVDEVVCQYNILEKGDFSFWGLSRKSIFIPENDIIYCPENKDDKFYTFGAEKYNLLEEYNYKTSGCFYYPVSIDRKVDKSSFGYGTDIANNVIFSCSNYGEKSWSAFDAFFHGDGAGYRSLLNAAINSQDTYNACKKFYDGISKVDIYEQSDEFIDLTLTEEFEFMMSFLESVVDLSFLNKCAELSNRFNELGLIDFNFINELSWYYFFILTYEYPELGIDVWSNFIEILLSDFSVVRYNLERLYLSDYNWRYIYNDRLEVFEIPESKHLKLFILTQQQIKPLSCAVTHDGEISFQSISPGLLLDKKPYFSDGEYEFQVVDINLEDYENITAVSLRIYQEDVYAALVPADAVFEAISYNPNGTIYAKFNQLGELEVYEYDDAQRVACVRNRDGDILREYSYNNAVINQ